MLDSLVKLLGNKTKLYSLLAIAIGLLLIWISPTEWLIVPGCILVGLGYGIIQPLIYDKTVDTAIPQKTTLALAFCNGDELSCHTAFSLHHRLFPMDIPYRFARISVYLQSVHNNIDYVLGVCKEEEFLFSD